MKFHPTDEMTALDERTAQLQAELQEARDARTEASRAWWKENTHLFDLSNPEDAMELIQLADPAKEGWNAWDAITELFNKSMKTGRVTVEEACVRYDPSGQFRIPFFSISVNLRGELPDLDDLAADVNAAFAMLHDSIKHSNVITIDKPTYWETVFLVRHCDGGYGLHSGNSHRPFRAGDLKSLLATA